MFRKDLGDASVFGTGADGNVTITANTTLTGDKNYNNLTVNAGVTLSPDGYLIKVKDTLVNNGTISRAATTTARSVGGGILGGPATGTGTTGNGFPGRGGGLGGPGGAGGDTTAFAGG
jgi:hypothetical protein